MFELIDYVKECVNTVLEKDPAATSFWQIFFFNPGVKALYYHYRAHKLWTKNKRFRAMRLAYRARKRTGIEIHPAAKIGKRLLLDHGMGLVIGETAVVGDDCTIYHSVTLGGLSKNKTKRHPTIGNGVLIGAGSIILGNISVGDRAKIGANSVVLEDVPPGATAVGSPAKIIPGK